MMKTGVLSVMLASALCLAAGLATAGDMRLEDLELDYMVQGWGEATPKATILNKKMTINGVTFDHGVGTHSVSRFTVDLKESALAFRAKVGLDDETSEFEGSIAFRVYTDKELAYDSGIMRLGDGPEDVNVDLRGVKRLDLVVTDGGDTNNYDHADWADAVIVLDPEASETPEAIARQELPTEILTPPESDAPQINAPSVIGAGPDREFSYYLPITGERPLAIEVGGLPDGIVLDERAGILHGQTGAPGEWPLSIRVGNESGRDTKEVLLSVGDGIALTPPMGWNSWNCWGKTVSDEHIRDAARAMADTGLINHGWTYICIDDTWEGERDPETLRLGSNEKFPDMEALGAYVHGLGLKFGIYTDVGYMTCQQFEGSRGYDFLDADTFARWGVDYVKADWCYAHGMLAKASYTTFDRAIQATGRDMVFSVCTAGYSAPWEWGEEAGGNLWRTAVDIRDNWHSVYTNVSKEHYSLYEYAKPGHWNDPDMLVVGKVGWSEPLRDSLLTPAQQYSHISLWSLLAAPLILGCDLTQLDEFTLNLLTNDEVIAINQDALGQQARRVIQEDRLEVWKKELADGSFAIGIFNFAPAELDETSLRECSVSWESLGLEGPQTARDLWRQKDLGEFQEAFTVSLPEFGVSLIRVKSANSPAR